MTMDKEALSGMTTRQKAIAAVIVLVVILLIWQVVSMLGGEGHSDKSMSQNKIAMPNSMVAKGGTMQPNSAPQPAQLLAKDRLSSQAQDQLAKIQIDNQARYIAAMNEIQQLKLAKQIAETNQAIAAAKLATVTSEKGVLDLLTRPEGFPPAPTYSQQLGNPNANAQANNQANGPPTPVTSPDAKYSVISVSLLLDKWNAVLGYQGKLYSVSVGDVLPADGSTVVSIDKYNVVLEKEGVKTTLPMISII